ncbi:MULTISPECIES: molybdopterin molybdotransferase MoeA [unclassified Campylobacter]|uniref:molybdopterin molybdotransferase MoeA n=1 Tax=unclassified Campylobacter TaxID=2593542 RepID=UPI001237F491|nr:MULTISPECIES: molybdopterin molybdotransferase MoeA [unclassified Campylobacter]KAA6226393.1 molybdopterin molybdotransferase MoeA [Campylobacter sp. LR286c]KAA6226569.1 molybdopterin molybdotransferase MoeA [Campylobacter sp. LR185c]KAA6226884.1 molybdopterin molybdotransferase MoeA [Campylobacter sp. LR196d]KAA8603625.1 molybdopterin molybdenumtransferase MoeA [Campylobacter sp. LR185c]
MMDTWACLSFLEENIKSLKDYELISIDEAKDRYLAVDIYAKKNMPSYDNSALDGYAFNFNDRFSPLNIKESIFAGDKKSYKLKKNEAYKIMTGAKIPENADTIIRFEDVKFKDEKLFIDENIKQFNAIRFKAEEVKKDAFLFKKGECLNASKLTLLAAQGIYKIYVIRKIKIGIFSSGNELSEPWQECDENRIYNANATAIRQIFSKNCFECSYLGIMKDEFETTKKALNNENFDLLITSGGASVGEADFMLKALKELKFTPLFENVRTKMTMPTKLFKKNKTLVLILPGNPMSAFLGCFIFGLKITSLLSGNLGKLNKIVAKMAFHVNLKEGRNNLILGNLENGVFIPTNKGKLSSSMILPIVQSEFLLISKKEEKELQQNQEVEIIKLV